MSPVDKAEFKLSRGETYKEAIETSLESVLSTKPIKKQNNLIISGWIKERSFLIMY